MNQNPKVSIVMPSYNRSRVIQHAIRSCIDQTFKDWELIVVDDGSTDNTERVVKDFADDRIKYHKIPHSGYVSVVRNVGNKLALADIIVVHDSDDMAFPDRLEEIVKAFDETSADIVYHGMYVRMFDPYHNAVCRLLRKAQPYDKQHILTEQYIPGQVAYKKKCILETPYDERIRCCDDYQMLLEFALKDYTFHTIDKNLYEYVDSSDSINVGGEMDGSRRKDVEIILQILREKYNINGVASLFKNTVGGPFDGQLISSEIVK